MLDVLRYWLVLLIFGWLALPLAWRLLAFLPDRGYAFGKALGLLAAGYILWLLTTFGLLRNMVGGVLLAMALVLGLGLWLGRAGLQRDESGTRPLLAFLRSHVRYVLLVEIFFLLALIAWSAFRAYNPEISGTEKPMEFAFLNGILTSSQFPPRDPWLSGYAISYYYFGYILQNMLAQLTGVAPGVAFNLGLATTFALTLLGAFGLVYNLVAGDEDAPASRARAAIYGGVGALFVGLMGNLEGVLEVLRVRGLLPETVMRFFDVKNLDTAAVTGVWNPNSGFWWWWRASRVVHDYDFSGRFDQEVITEFPFFSYLLGDMHPHVLALPFVLLALALALNLFRRPASALETAAETGWRAAWTRVRAIFGLNGWGILVMGLGLGALGFLNTWDFPIYWFVVMLAFALRRGLNGARLDGGLVRELLLAGGSLLVVGVVGYLPFYLTFSSQASGIWPNFYNPTRFAQYALMFGPFLVAVIFTLAAAYRRAAVPRRALLRWLLAALLLPAVFLGVALLAAYLVPGLRTTFEQLLGQSAQSLITRVLALRAGALGVWVFVGVLLALIGALAARAWSTDSARPGRTLTFALALFFTAFLLTYGVEFVFLRDTFGTRMNTVFKFYYQAWILLAIGSAYGLYYLSTRASAALRITGQVLVGALVLGGLVYTVFAIPGKANNFQGAPTLDGAAFVAQYRPDEAAVITWLRANTRPDDVVVEATGGSYSDFNTISAHSGRATLLGWGGHELQWRGTYDEPGRREPLLVTIYNDSEPERIAQIVDEFGIDYLIVGPREMDEYSIARDRVSAFARLWEPVFQQGDYTVFRWRGL